MITIYGIKNCDACQKALRYFAGKAEFRDVRTSPLSAERLEQFCQSFGNQIINTRSKTWKTLTDNEKSYTPLEILKAFPTVMKRPVISCSESSVITIGWDEQVKRHYD